MGTKANLGVVQVQPEEAQAFAARFDPFPPHLTGQGNAVLPARSASGLYVAMLAHQRLLLDADLAARVICGTHVAVSFRNPIVLGEALAVEATWDEKSRESRSLGTVVERTTNLTVSCHGTIAIEYQIHHLLYAE